MSKSYSVGLVGESNYQEAIASLQPNERVFLRPEPDNPHDPRAIVARRADDAPIGYLPRDHWLTNALIDEGKGSRALVERVAGRGAESADLGVVLSVALGEKGAPVGAAPPSPKTFRIVALIVGGILSLFVLLIVIGIAVEDPKVAAERAEQRKAEVAASEKADAADAKTERDRALAARTDAGLAWYRQILAAAKPCDDATATLGKEFTAIGSGGSIYTAFDAADASSQACNKAWGTLRGLEVPDGFEGEAETKAEEANKVCGNGYFAKTHFADLAKEVLDGDSRPSKVSEAKQYAELSGGAALVCVASVIDALSKAGVDVTKLPAS